MFLARSLASAASAAVVTQIAVLDQVAMQQLAQPGVVVDDQDVRCLLLSSLIAPDPSGQPPQQLASRLAHQLEQHAAKALHRRGPGVLERQPQPPLLQVLDLAQHRGRLAGQPQRALAAVQHRGALVDQADLGQTLEMPRQGLLADAQHAGQLRQGDSGMALDQKQGAMVGLVDGRLPPQRPPRPSSADDWRNRAGRALDRALPRVKTVGWVMSSSAGRRPWRR